MSTADDILAQCGRFILLMVEAERVMKERPGQLSVWALVGPDVWRAVGKRYGLLVDADVDGRGTFCGIAVDVAGEPDRFMLVVRDRRTGRCKVRN